MNADRRAVLAAFIRGQCNLTDKHPHVPGPGSVHLNHDEANLAADALEQATGDGDVSLDAAIKRHVLAVLDRVDGDKRAAALLLGVSLKTVYNYLNEWGRK